jgi:branched-chain amino acid aminotransferase
MKVYIDGQFYDKEDAKISVFDHGLLYGDGVFEGIRAYNGRVFMLREHIDRLYDSAKAIDLEIGMERDEMIAKTVEACRVNAIDDGYIRLVVTRGIGTLGLNPYLCEKASVIIIAAKIQLYPPELYEQGLRLVTVGTTRNLAEAVNPRIKSLNYLNNIMAKIEAINSGVMECIMLNSAGQVAEASGDNVFVVKGDKLITPPTWCGALKGVTQDVVMKLAGEMGCQAGFDVLSRYDLYTADEVFLTGTAAEIIGVIDIDKRRIGSGQPGPVTRRLEAAYKELARSSGEPIKL